MTVEQFRKVLRAQPFRPFTMRLAHGSTVFIPHPDFVFTHPESPRTVALADSDGAFLIVDLLQVSAIDIGDGKSRKNGKNRKKAGG